jgi:predicted dehydrogenase
LYTTLYGQNVTLTSDVPRTPANSYQRLLENFVRHLNGDPTAELVTPEQALTAVSIIDAIQRSAASGREEQLVL